MRGGPDDPASIELLERLGRRDPCPCGSGKRFQALLSRQRAL
ncbi:SEC-C metal-binding domain-containing protein [Novosphingobium cyanobacteriorum]